MKLGRIGAAGRERPVVWHEDHVHDLRPLTRDIDGEFLAGGGLEATRNALRSGDLPETATDGERFGSPVPRPSAIICIGMNYAAHAAESGSAPPRVPVIFLKTPNTLGGPDDPVAIPRRAEKTDWEVELGVVIGSRASYLGSPSEVPAHVAGLVTANDLSERTFQFEESGGQWSKGKCSPGFSPVGPWLVPYDEVDHRSLRLRSWVNGEPRQDSNTSDMIFDVDTIIWNLSQYLTLEPGDVVLTGTPQGVALSGRFPYLRVGDVVEVEVEGLGRQRQVFTAAD